MAKETSLADLVVQVLSSWGKKAIVVRVPAIHPKMSREKLDTRGFFNSLFIDKILSNSLYL